MYVLKTWLHLHRDVQVILTMQLRDFLFMLYRTCTLCLLGTVTNIRLVSWSRPVAVEIERIRIGHHKRWFQMLYGQFNFRKRGRPAR